MGGDRSRSLRGLLEEIDARLLDIMDGQRPLADGAIEKVATLETARGAVSRLLAAAQAEENRRDESGD